MSTMRSGAHGCLLSSHARSSQDINPPRRLARNSTSQICTYGGAFSPSSRLTNFRKFQSEPNVRVRYGPGSKYAGSLKFQSTISAPLRWCKTRQRSSNSERILTASLSKCSLESVRCPEYLHLLSAGTMTTTCGLKSYKPLDSFKISVT